MNINSTFISSILAHPWDHGPKMVWADHLDESGDRRGSWLRYWCELERTSLEIARKWPFTSLIERDNAIYNYPCNIALLAVVLALLTPADEIHRTRDFLKDPRSIRAAIFTGLTVCGLVSREELVGAQYDAEAARRAIASIHAEYSHNPYVYWAAAAAERTPLVEISTDEPVHALRQLLETISWGEISNGWQVRCCQSLAKLPMPPMWNQQSNV
jgi:uncharacterized protein (TIGR02996 family)